MLSAGMFAARAVSRAAFRSMLAFGSPPLRAATVISRRILEKSLPRWTSVLPFLRLICDHRECPDTFAPSQPSLDGAAGACGDRARAARGRFQRARRAP